MGSQWGVWLGFLKGTFWNSQVLPQFDLFIWLKFEKSVFGSHKTHFILMDMCFYEVLIPNDSIDTLIGFQYDRPDGSLFSVLEHKWLNCSRK